MTYAEIIKKLEIYSDGISGMHEDFDPGLQETCVNAIDFINRQKAEIEMLSSRKEVVVPSMRLIDGNPLNGFNLESDRFVARTVEDVKAEAYKECIEKINKNLNRKASFGSMVESVICEIIISENDNLLKKLAGGKE